MTQLQDVAALFTQAEAVIALDDRINYLLYRYNPFDWSPLLIAVVVVWAGVAGCALEPDYEDPEPFCSQALECWEEADGDLKAETACKWDWPNDWQLAEEVFIACAGHDPQTVTCEEMLEECNAHE